MPRTIASTAWVWMLTNPGVRTWPRASMMRSAVVAPASVAEASSAMRSSRMPTTQSSIIGSSGSAVSAVAPHTRMSNVFGTRAGSALVFRLGFTLRIALFRVDQTRSEVFQEPPCPWLSRRAKNLSRQTLLYDGACVQEYHAVGNLARERHLMRDDHRGHTLPSEHTDHVQHLAYKLGIQRRGRLVVKHDDRPEHNGTCDGHTLLLSAGELPGKFHHVIAEENAPQLRGGPLPRLRFRHSTHLVKADRHVIERG